MSIDVLSPREILALIDEAEAAGVERLWLTQVSESTDALAILAAAFVRTERINLGTSIVPIYPLHPLAMAQQAATVGALANGRFRLGVGPSTRSRVKRVYGIDMTSPLDYLGEYVSILKPALQQGIVDHDGRFFTAHLAFDNPPSGTPILTSALGKEAFAQAGRLADGAISWNCPVSYLQSVGLPAMHAAAAASGRPTPPLITHVCVALTSDGQAAMDAGATHLGFYTKHPFYAKMFATAGFPIPADQSVPIALVEDLVIHGNESEVADRLLLLLAAGCDELLVTNLPIGDRATADTRLIQLLGKL